MDWSFFYKGLAIGFLITTPVGVVGALCIRRMLTQGRLVGFVSGLGGSAADAVYAALAALGLTFVAEFLVAKQVLLRFLGGLFLLYLGPKVFLSRPSLEVRDRNVTGLMGDFLSIFFLALTNPMLILSLAAVFAAFDLTLHHGGYASVGLLVGAIFLGSAAWWIIMTFIGGLLKLKWSEEELRWINRGAGVVVTCFGLVVLLSVVWKHH